MQHYKPLCKSVSLRNTFEAFNLLTLQAADTSRHLNSTKISPSHTHQIWLYIYLYIYIYSLYTYIDIYIYIYIYIPKSCNIQLMDSSSLFLCKSAFESLRPKSLLWHIYGQSSLYNKWCLLVPNILYLTELSVWICIFF